MLGGGGTPGCEVDETVGTDQKQQLCAVGNCESRENTVAHNNVDDEGS